MGIKIEPNAAYAEMAPRAKRIRDLVNGEFKLKTNDIECLGSLSKPEVVGMSKSYLRQLSPGDGSMHNKLRNGGFINGSRLFNATGRTLKGLMGMMYRVMPVDPELNPKMQYLFENADGAGLSMNQQSKSVSSNVLQVGRHGLLTDMPDNSEGVEITEAMVKEGFRPSIQEYTSENILDWDESVIMGAKVLSLLVLREISSKLKQDRISRETVETLRVFRLENDVVTVQLYVKNDDLEYDEGPELPVLTGFNKKPMSRIPFDFVGSVNNTPKHDDMPLEPLTDTNIGHYQESANLRSSSFQLSAAQGVISDDKYREVVEDENEGEEEPEVGTGEESFILLGSGGSFAFHSPDPNTLSSALMIADEDRMVSLGAQLVMGSGQAETAEAARIKRSSDISVLDSVASNVADAYTNRIKSAYEFVGIPWDEANYDMNREFFDTKLTPQEITARVQLWQSGGISKDVMDRVNVVGGVIPEGVDLEEMNEEIQAEKAAQGGIDFDEDGEPVEEETKPKEEKDKSKSPIAKTGDK